MGTGAKNRPVERRERRAKGHHRRRRVRRESTLEIIDGLLTRQVTISVRGQVKRVPAAEAIMLQLMQKAMAGNTRATRVSLKYKEFAERGSEKATELQFVESDYTRAVANFSLSSDDG